MQEEAHSPNSNIPRICKCGNTIPPRHRKYCHDCAPRASALWKQAMRRQNSGSKYWLDPWLKAADDAEGARLAYNGYMREYMRRYRAEVADREAVGN